MQRRLLLLCFTLCLCAYGFAFDSGNYLVRNVSTGKYLGAANSWGTQASLVSNPEYVTWTKLDDGKYHLESQVNNGDKAYYFNGDYMDNDTPIALTIEQQTSGYYTISNGEIYYGYDGSSSILGKTETNPAAANVQWEIVSVTNATSALTAATQSNPLNATFLIADPNFGRNNRHYNQWTFEASNKNNSGDVTNYCVESWHATFTMSQTVTVPNGVYALTAQGFYRQDGNDNDHLPVFYLNDAKRVFPVKIGTENSMEQASASFSKGLYATDPIFVKVTNGTITLGARLEGNTQLWCIWDNFTLMYYGTDTNADQMNFDTRFSKLVAEAKSILQREGISTEGKNLLNNALNNYDQLTTTSSETAQQAVVNQLNEGIAYAKTGLNLAEQLANTYNYYGPRLSSTAPNDNTVKSLLMSIATALSSKVYESNAQIEEWLANLKSARQQYYPYEYRYWFDNDEKTAILEVSTTQNWHLDVDLSSLSESFHAFHLQVIDKDDVMSSPVTRHFIKVPDMTAVSTQYWFDDNTANIHTAPQSQGVFDIDVSDLSEGFHTIRYQLIGNNGTTSNVISRIFYKTYIPSNSSWRCWFDNDHNTMQSGKDMSQTLLLDVSQLSDGYHVLHIQVEGGARSASTPITKHFVKIPQTIGVDHFTCLFMVDDKLVKQDQVAAEGGVVEWDVDVSALSQGFHRFFVQVVTPSGAASNTWQSFFLRETTNAEFAEMKCVYAIDGAEFYTEAGTLADGTYHFDLDVSALDDGLHRITYMLNNGKGVNTKAQTQFFMKTPLGGNGISEYWYWLNEEADSKAQKVVLPERTDPFSLITLLPVESQPIRSKLFQFRMEQDQPVIYAKNDIHLRFFDASGRFTNATKQYVDESVKHEVEPVDDLQKTQTFPKISENDIRWYTMQVAPGDTAAFRVSQAATLQVFAPSGKEVFKTSESASVKWGGIHTWEEGTYYVAVHDVTGSQSNITLDYLHMDKYDMVEWNVHRVGNGGCSTITFKGNGFRDLWAVDLYTAAGDTIHSVDISHDSDAETAITFDFSGAKLGVYNAVFHFTQEDKHFDNIVTVEEAVDIELATNVSFPSTFLRGTSTTYTIKITNKGNMTAYNVPIYIFVSNPSLNGISHISLQGLELGSLAQSVTDFDGWTDEEIGSFEKRCKQIGEDHYFMKLKTINEDTGDSIIGRYGVFFTELPQKQTKIISLTIATSERVEAWISVPQEWESAYCMNNTQKMAPRRSNPLKNWFCCHHEKIECITGLVSNAADIAGLFPMLPASTAIGVGGCISGLINQISDVSSQIFCSDNKPEYKPGNQLKDLAKGISWYSWILSCLNNFVPAGQAKQIISEIVAVGDLPGTMQSLVGVSGSCRTAWSKKKPNCPPKHPTGGSSTPQPPYDPNDIYGYLSEAGSKFMTDDVAKVNYTIEFENDTTFAQASAHSIVISDTLDSRYFDLASFLPTSMKIGEHETFLDETKDVKTAGSVTSFLKTIDMRPEIDAIAQVEGEYSQQTGIAKWTFTSLDPMTMEPTNDLMQGILPVNYDGTSGIGKVMFEVGMKPNKANGTEVNNRASIVFDYEDAILTPTWTNIVDRVEPVSSVKDVTILNDSTAVVAIDAFDNLSGCWRYDVYMQYGEGSAWWKAAENVNIDTTASVKIYDGINHGFYVVVTDSAGNVEKKEPVREATLFDGKTTLIETPSKTTIKDFYDLQGRKVDGVLKKNGIYIMTDGDKKKSQKVVKK